MTITELRQQIRVVYRQTLDYMETEDPNRELTESDYKFIYAVVLPAVDRIAKEAWPERHL
jgi:hypothetical protein